MQFELNYFNMSYDNEILHMNDLIKLKMKLIIS